MPQRPADRDASRQRFLRSLALGGSVTALVVIASALGLFAPLERVALDYRFKNFQSKNPPPSTRIVHIDIDDNSLRTIGRWPWHRSKLAAVVDELKAADAAVIAFDLLLNEPEQPRLVETADGSKPVRVDDDAVFAAAVAGAGNVLLPVDMELHTPPLDPLIEQCRTILMADPLMSFEALKSRANLSPLDARRIRDQLGTLRTSAIRRRVAQVVPLDLPEKTTPPSFDEVRKAVLPALDASITSSSELQTLRDEYDRAVALHATIAHTRPLTGLADFITRGRSTIAPFPPLARAQAAAGFVTAHTDADGVVRSVPLWLADEHRLYPHFALSLACQFLHVPLHKLIITETSTTIPRATMLDGSTRDIVIPHTPRRPGDRTWLSSHDQLLIPWPQAAEWRYLYDPQKTETKQHLPIGLLVELHELRLTAERNAAAAHAALMQLDQLKDTTPDLKKQLESLDVLFTAHSDGYEKQRTAVVDPLIDPDFGINLKDPAAAATPAGKLLTQHLEARKQADAAHAKLNAELTRIRQIVGQSVCIVGWTSTGAIADFVATPLEAKVPGPMIHGAVLNAILTNHFYRRAPLGIDLLLVAALGLLVTTVSARFSPIVGLIATALLAAAYFIINGVVLFDTAGLWADAASPLAAAALTWPAVTVYRLVAEQRDRARITRQFKNYVSPDLVDYLVQNPGVVKMEGERRELTCMFTDFEKFTTISEQLGPEKTVAVLNAYLGVATEKLMEHRATVNKYIGDAIVAFWGAPIPNEFNALDACRAALVVIRALDELKQQPHMADMPHLHMRIGLATGIMMVGDMGAPPRRSDYTVLGDTVNLGSRIEGVNKQFGTQILISSRTHELVADKMLTRPVGRVVVVGRKGFEPLFELMSTREAATQQQIGLAQATTEAIDAYYRADFPRALALFTAIEQTFGPSKLAQRYITAATHHIEQNTPAENFDGAFHLTEK
jgi:class 3 adenylate cyclase